MKMGTLEKRLVNATAHSRHVAEQAVRRLRYVPVRAGWSYLDVGCGNGQATLHVADALGLRAVGGDLERPQIELARRAACNRTDVSFVTASATQLPFDTARFDIVATNKTMHHVPDWWLALDEIKRVVAPGGYVMLREYERSFGTCATASADRRSRCRRVHSTRPRSRLCRTAWSASERGLASLRSRVCEAQSSLQIPGAAVARGC